MRHDLLLCAHSRVTDVQPPIYSATGKYHGEMVSPRGGRDRAPLQQGRYDRPWGSKEGQPSLRLERNYQGLALQQGADGGFGERGAHRLLGDGNAVPQAESRKQPRGG